MCKLPLYLCVLFVALFAILHLVRFLWSFPVIIGTFVVPLWVSPVLFVAFGLLAAWAFRSLCPCCKSNSSCSRSEDPRL